MTHPLSPLKRTTAAERRANREAFAQLKEQRLAANRPKNRRCDHRHKVRTKLRRIIKDRATVLPFTALQLGVLFPRESEVLAEYLRIRLSKLTPEERQRVRANLHLSLATMGEADWQAFVSYDGAAGLDTASDTGSRTPPA